LVVVFGLAVCFVLAFSLLGWVGVYVCFIVLVWGLLRGRYGDVS